MTTLIDSSSRSYDGNGLATVFATGFKFLDASHLTVTRTTGGVKVTLALNVDYAVDGAGVDAGGNVTMLLGAPTALQSIAITRNTPVLQVVDLRPDGPYEADTLEAMTDRLTLICQELERRIAAEEAGAVSVVLASQTLTKNFTPFADPPESNFPVNVACTGTPTAVFLARVEDLTDGTNVHVGLGSPDWGSPVLNQFALKYCPGLTPAHNYRITLLVLAQ